MLGQSFTSLHVVIFWAPSCVCHKRPCVRPWIVLSPITSPPRVGSYMTALLTDNSKSGPVRRGRGQQSLLAANSTSTTLLTAWQVPGEPPRRCRQSGGYWTRGPTASVARISPADAWRALRPGGRTRSADLPFRGPGVPAATGGQPWQFGARASRRDRMTKIQHNARLSHPGVRSATQASRRGGGLGLRIYPISEPGVLNLSKICLNLSKFLCVLNSSKFV